MDQQEEMIAQFRSVADTSEERAKFFLESSQWQLAVALSSFYDTSGTANEPKHEDPMDVEPQAMDMEEVAPIPPQGAKKVKKGRSSKFASIHDLSEDDDSSEEEGQRFYAGGSEQSGELIVGPPRKKQSNEEITKSLFKEAKKHGAQTAEAGSKDSGKSGDSTPKYFTGGGYKLGETEDSSEFVPGQEAPGQEGPVNVVLRLWSNGFTVDDGPLRDFNDPDNQEFLTSIRRGQIPRELIRNAQGGEVHVDMEDHRQEEFKAPKKKLKVFSGKGHMLGSPAPEFSTNTGHTSSSTSSSVDPPVVVDKSKPTTVIQVRLSDGKRLKQEFNQSHRISDIRSFLINSNPSMASRPFILMTTFPNKQLDDESLTLSDAKLLNALVVQKLV